MCRKVTSQSIKGLPLGAAVLLAQLGIGIFGWLTAAASRFSTSSVNLRAVGIVRGELSQPLDDGRQHGVHHRRTADFAQQPINLFATRQHGLARQGPRALSGMARNSLTAQGY